VVQDYVHHPTNIKCKRSFTHSRLMGLSSANLVYTHLHMCLLGCTAGVVSLRIGLSSFLCSKVA
jgi:hypothetical protein